MGSSISGPAVKFAFELPVRATQLELRRVRVAVTGYA